MEVRSNLCYGEEKLWCNHSCFIECVVQEELWDGFGLYLWKSGSSGRGKDVMQPMHGFKTIGIFLKKKQKGTL